MCTPEMRSAWKGKTETDRQIYLKQKIPGRGVKSPEMKRG